MERLTQEQIMQLDRKDSITLILKPTNMCNLDCTYCYDKPARTQLASMKMSIEMVERALYMASVYAKNVTVLWHGGEPLLMDKDFYYKATDIMLDMYSTNFKQLMQTNGYMIQKDASWVDVFKECEIKVGTSYDGAFQYVRTNTTEDDYMVRTMKILVDNGLSTCGGLTVIHNDNIREMIGMYEFLKDKFKGEYRLKYNLGFGTKEVPSEIFNIPPEDVYHYFKEFYKYMLEDESNMAMLDSRFTERVQQLVDVTQTHGCENRDCRQKWLTVLANGTLLNCSRFAIYHDFGNLMDYDSIDEIFSSEKYMKYYNLVESRLNGKCKECPVFSLCNGGCNAKFLRATEQMQLNHCEYIKNLHLATYNALMEVEPIKNKEVIALVKRTQYFVPSIVAKVLETRFGYTEKASFNDVAEMVDSKLYRITRRLNEFRKPIVLDMLNVQEILKHYEDVLNIIEYEEFKR